jgi:hypothetical protein
VAYGWSVAFGALYSILLALSALAFAIGTGPGGESPEWVVPVAVVMFVCALAAFFGVMTTRVRSTAIAFTAGALVSIPALRLAMLEWSDEADGELLALASCVAVAGLVAVTLTAKASRAPTDAN